MSVKRLATISLAALTWFGLTGCRRNDKPEIVSLVTTSTTKEAGRERNDPPMIDPALIGEWKWETMNGEPAPIPRTATFKADGVCLSKDLEHGDELTSRYVVDVKATPAHFDYVFENSRLRGIYKVEGNTLTICYVQAERGKRPTEFKGIKNEIALMVYSRIKPTKGGQAAGAKEKQPN